MYWEAAEMLLACFVTSLDFAIFLEASIFRAAQPMLVSSLGETVLLSGAH